MTKREAEDRARMFAALERLGFTADECDVLRRISLALHRWAERECNGEVEVDDDGKAFAVCGANSYYGRMSQFPSRWPTPNREAGALRRLSKIMASRKRRLIAYHQGDPRGASLYIIERKRLPKGANVAAYYSGCGVAVY